MTQKYTVEILQESDDPDLDKKIMEKHRRIHEGMKRKPKDPLDNLTKLDIRGKFKPPRREES